MNKLRQVIMKKGLIILISLVIVVTLAIGVLLIIRTPIVSFVTFGGSEISSTYVSKGGKIDKPTDPVRDDLDIFEGWYTNLTFNEKIDFDNDVFVNNSQIYAKWTSCAVFTLYFGREGCYGSLTGDKITYQVPIGNYQISMLNYEETADSCKVYVVNSENYSNNSGYDIISQTYLDFQNDKTIISIQENELIEITTNSLVLFESMDVPATYLNYYTNYTDWIKKSIYWLIVLDILILIVVIFVSISYFRSAKKCFYNDIILFLTYNKDMTFLKLAEITGIKLNKIQKICTSNLDLINFHLPARIKVKVEYNDDKKPYKLIRLTLEENNKMYSKNIHQALSKEVKLQGTKLFEKELKQKGFYFSNIIKYENNLLTGDYNAMYIDNDKKKIVLNETIYNFSDIISFELCENGESKISGRSGTALIGGAFFGLGGAIVGSVGSRSIKKTCNSMKIRIRINNVANPEILIILIKKSVLTNSSKYKKYFEIAKTLCAILEYILYNKSDIANEASTALNENTTASITDEIRSYKKLLDDGLITDAEYEQMKNNILNKQVV